MNSNVRKQLGGVPGPGSSSSGAPGSRPYGVIGSRNNDMTDAHRQGLQMLRERDSKIVSDRDSDIKCKCSIITLLVLYAAYILNLQSFRSFLFAAVALFFVSFCLAYFDIFV
jgi:hypothetical protein